MSKLYIETTIPSFYYNQRPEPEMVARCNWTRQWWDAQISEFEAATSYLVIEELEKGEAEPGAPCVALYSPVDNMVLPNHALQATGAGWIHQETSPISHVAMLYHRQTAELVVEYLKSMANAKN